MLAWTFAVLAAAFLAFVVGAVWYGALFGTAAASLSPAYAVAASPSGATIAFEALRCVVLAVALTILVQWTGTTTLGGALALGLIVWGGFQAAGLAGAVVHESYPLGLYLIHTGDALTKALVAAGTLVLAHRWLA
jgi:Protein of unknown function (DUF1761)